MQETRSNALSRILGYTCRVYQVPIEFYYGIPINTKKSSYRWMDGIGRIFFITRDILLCEAFT